MKKLCEKNCIGNHCTRDLKLGDCHLLTPVLYLAAHRNPQGLILAMGAAGFVFDHKSDSFIERRD